MFTSFNTVTKANLIRHEGTIDSRGMSVHASTTLTMTSFFTCVVKVQDNMILLLSIDP